MAEVSENKTITIFGIYSDNVPNEIYIGSTTEQLNRIAKRYENLWNRYLRGTFNSFRSVFTIYSYEGNLNTIKIVEYDPRDDIYEVPDRIKEVIKFYTENGWKVVNDNFNKHMQRKAKKNYEQKQYEKKQKMSQIRDKQPENTEERCANVIERMKRERKKMLDEFRSEGYN